MFVEAKGKRSKAKKELHHLRIHAGEGASHAHPSWTVEHHFTDRKHEPQVREFSDHAELMKHLHDNTHPDVNVDEEGGE